MATYSDSWGIEVGADAIKAVRLERTNSGVRVADWDVLPFKKILTTPDLNVDEAIQVNLDAFLAKHDIEKANVVASVPGNMAFARFAKLPPVEPKKIPDIVRFEAVQQIPFPIEQVEWDYQVFQHEDSPDVEVGIFAITKERVMNYLANFRRVNLRVDALTLSPLAVYNQYAYETAEDEDVPGTILLDIGTTSTDVIIVEEGGIWVRTLPIGGNNFTEALVKSFKLSFPKAEKLKREARTSKYARQIFQAMRPIFADLVQEIQRSIGYYQSINRDSDLRRVIGYGSTFRLPGLQKFLKQQLQMDVTRPDGFKRISVEGSRSAEFAESAVNLATAYGLALQGLGAEEVSCNIMPQAIVHQRLWRSKQPWFAAAAAVVAVAAGIALGRVYIDRGAFQSALEESGPVVTGAIRDANREATLYNELSKDNPALQIEDINRLLDYQDLWPKIIADISQAVRDSAGNRAELFEANYTEMDFGDRTNWPRIFIDQVEVSYLPEGVPQQGATRPGSTAQGPYGGMPPGGPTASAAGTQPLWSQATTADQFFDEQAKKAPVFQVTVRGTSPLNNADVANLISQRLMRSLNQHNRQPNRPYQMVIDPNTMIISLTTIAVGPAAPGGGYGGAATRGRTLRPDMNRPDLRRPAPRLSPRNNAYAGPPEEYYDEMPPELRGGRTTETFSFRAGDVGSLIPMRPGTPEGPEATPQADSQFVLQWYVRIKPPRAAREAAAQTRRDGAQPAPAPAPEPAPEPEQPQPATPDQALIRPGGDATASEQEAQS